MQHTAQMEVDTSPPLVGEGDTVFYLDEVEASALLPEIQKAKQTDPFFKVHFETLPRKFKQKANRLEKKLEGVDGAKTKYVDPELVTGYSLFNVVVPPYDLEALGQLYDESYILRSVVDARVMNTVGLGATWEPTTKANRQTEKAGSDEKKATALRTAHQKEIDGLIQAFEDLNQEDSLAETLIKVWTDVLTLGNGYLEVGRTPIERKIGYFGHVPSNLVRVRRPRDGFVQQASHVYVFFRNFGDTETVDPVHGDPNPNELIHFKLYSPTNNFYGVPPSVSALTAIVGDKFAKEYNIDYFENKAIPRYAIVLKGVKLSAKSKQEIIQYFRNEVKGTNHGTLVIPLPSTIGNQSEADIKFEKLEADVQEASFDKYRKSNRDEVVVAYRTPPTKIAIFEDANLAVSRDADKTFKSQVIGPDQDLIENKINRITKEFSDLFTLSLEQFDLIDDDTRSRIHDRYVRTQVLTPNEVRQEVGKQPVSSGDTVLPYPNANLKYTSEVLSINERRDQEGLGSVPGGEKVLAVETANKVSEVGGGQPGNSNAQGGSPQKSGEDNSKSPSDKDVVGTNAERGQVQDQGKTRERTGG